MTRLHAGFATMAAIASSMGVVAAAGTPDGADVSPVFGVKLPSDYRQWQVVTVAHEAGQLNDIRVVLGNPLAMKAFRTGRRPFPDGAAIARVAWKLDPSDRNNAVFGRPQSFVAGAPTNVQIERKDSKQYATTGGWGYGQFEGDKANPDAALMQTCHACHAKLPASADFIFSDYSK